MKYRVIAKEGKSGRMRWQIVSRETEKVAALCPIFEDYDTRGEAMRAGLEFVNGMQRPVRTMAGYLFPVFALGVAAGLIICRLGGG